MADRIGVINDGRLLLVEDKNKLMRQLGKKTLTIELDHPIGELTPELEGYGLSIDNDGYTLTYVYDTKAERTGIAQLLSALAKSGFRVRDLATSQSSLEDIFLDLVEDAA